MLTKKEALVFALVVSFAAETLDIIAHFLTGVEVHLPYVAVKLSVIAWTLFFTTKWNGIQMKHGIVGAAIASLMFYVYYRFAEATLDRTLFKLDEDTLMILIHFIAISIFYALALNMKKERKIV